MMNAVLLLFGLGTCARGVYALVTQDVSEDNERIVGRKAAWHGAVLVGIGLSVASHAIFRWRWVAAVVDWVGQLD